MLVLFFDANFSRGDFHFSPSSAFSLRTFHVCGDFFFSLTLLTSKPTYNRSNPFDGAYQHSNWVRSPNPSSFPQFPRGIFPCLSAKSFCFFQSLDNAPLTLAALEKKSERKDSNPSPSGWPQKSNLFLFYLACAASSPLGLFGAFIFSLILEERKSLNPHWPRKSNLLAAIRPAH